MFTWFQSAVGAWLLHVSSSAFLYDNGKVLGCSSLIYNVFASPNAFNAPTTAGLALAPLAMRVLHQYSVFPFVLPDYALVRASAPFGPTLTLVLSAMLTGIGTRLASGCTSGHMLMGVSRLSMRSIVATLSFVSSAAAVQWLFRTAPTPQFGLSASTPAPPTSSEVVVFGALAIAATVFGRTVVDRLGKGPWTRTIVSFFSGFVFSAGLLISRMADPAKTLGFLSFSEPIKFDPSLLMVFVFGVVPNAIRWYIQGPRLNKYAAVDSMDVPTKRDITPRLVLGSLIFGAGWGLSGICPGPGLISAVLDGYYGIFWLVSFVAAYQSTIAAEALLV